MGSDADSRDSDGVPDGSETSSTCAPSAQTNHRHERSDGRRRDPGYN